MTDLLVIAAPLLMLVLLYCGWRAWHLLLNWRAATAGVRKGGYSELDQLEDFWIKDDRFTTMGWRPLGGENSRLVEDEVSFVDREGRRHRATVSRYVQQGWRPDSIYTIWYDPDDPSKATAFGPGIWAGGALASAGALAWLFMGAPGLPQLI